MSAHPREQIEVLFEAVAATSTTETWCVEVDRDHWNRLDLPERQELLVDSLIDEKATYVKDLECDVLDREVVKGSDRIAGRKA